MIIDLFMKKKKRDDIRGTIIRTKMYFLMKILDIDYR